MANRDKKERNDKVWEYYKKGYRYQSIANIFKLKLSTVAMIIHRIKKEKAIE